MFGVICFVFIPTTPSAATHSCSGRSWDCSASPSMIFEQVQSSAVAAHLSLEAWTLHWTGVFQQTERLQASEITQKKGICFTFLVQTSHMFRQTKRWLQITNAGSTNNHEGIGWDFGTYQVHFIKEMEEPRQVSQLEKCMFYPCSFHQKWCSATQNWFLPTMTAQEVVLIRTKMINRQHLAAGGVPSLAAGLASLGLPNSFEECH